MYFDQIKLVEIDHVNRVEFDPLIAESGNKENELFNRKNEKPIERIEKK